jgi:hypothetical protein
MKIATKKVKERDPDDSLFGLLTAYKANASYVRILVNEKAKKIILYLTDNPKYFPQSDGEEFGGFRLISRSEMNINRLFIKYLSPEHIIDFSGQHLGLKLTPRTGRIHNFLADKGKRYFQLEMSQRMLPSVVLMLRKLVSLTPQKKYEIIEKYLANTAKPETQE